MSVIKINKNNFESVVINAHGPVLLDFYADWCGPCRMVSPIVEEISNENPQITVGKINVDEESELAAKFSIVSIPALFVLKNGKVTGSAIGFRPKEEILEILK